MCDYDMTKDDDDLGRIRTSLSSTMMEEYRIGGPEPMGIYGCFHDSCCSCSGVQMLFARVLVSSFEHIRNQAKIPPP
jgi:hypothetical protein